MAAMRGECRGKTFSSLMKLIFEDNREVPVEEFDSVLNSTEKFYNELRSISYKLDRLYSESNVNLMRASSKFQYYNGDIKDALENISYTADLIANATDSFSRDFED